MNTPIRFITNCPCLFTIDNKGITSNKEIPIVSTKSYKEDNVQTHEVLCNTRSNGNSVVSFEGLSSSGDLIINGNSVSSTGELRINGNLVVGGKITINGREISTVERSSAEVQTKQYHHSWDSITEQNPVLEKLSISGSSVVDVKLPLAQIFSVDASGYSRAAFYQFNRNKKFNANVSGSGEIISKTNDSLEQAKFNMSGLSTVSGFKVSNTIKAKISGSSSLSISDSTCSNVKVNLSGNAKAIFDSCNFSMGKFNISGNANVIGEGLSTIDNGHINVSGNGSFSGFTFLSKFITKVNGNGKIIGRCNDGCLGQRSISGNGKINILPL